MQKAESNKPKRLYFETYLKVIQNSVGSNMFRNFYIQTEDKGSFDALDDGDNSCAFYVSAILVIFKKLSGVHGTVDSTTRDLRESGWQEVSSQQAGDVLIWEAQQFEDGLKQHIGFCLGDGRAISTSQKQKTPIEHDEYFGNTDRKIVNIFRYPDWN